MRVAFVCVCVCLCLCVCVCVCERERGVGVWFESAVQGCTESRCGAVSNTQLTLPTKA